MTEEVVLEMHEFHPWRRNFARGIDVALYGFIWSAILILIFDIDLGQASMLVNIMTTVLTILTMLGVEPVLLSRYATTLGKAILGIRIYHQDGSLMSLERARERTWQVLKEGMGFSIPIYNLYRGYKSYDQLDGLQRLDWDQFLDYRFKDTHFLRIILFISARVFFFGMTVLLLLIYQLPPNRGDITVEEFVENHQHYEKITDIDLEYKLAPTGNWVKKESNGVIINSFYDLRPSYSYEVVDGNVKSISFRITIDDTKEWISGSAAYMQLIVLSLGNAHSDGLKPIWNDRMLNPIRLRPFDSYTIEKDGILITSEVELSGFETSSFGLIPKENEDHNHFDQYFVVSIVN